MDDVAENVLVRKLGASKNSRSPIPMIEELGDNFARMIESSLAPLLKTSTSALVMECEVTKLAPVLEGIPAPAMLGVVGIEDAENQALINISSDLVFHIVDLRMGGNSNNSPMPTARSFTGIDVILCVDIFNQLIESFSDAVSETLESEVTNRMQMTDFKQNVSMVRIAPENAEILQLTVSLDIGPAARNGDIDIIVPLSVLDVIRAATETAISPLTKRNPNDIWKNHMRKAAQASLVPLAVLLDRQKMQMKELEQLAPGDIIELPSSAKTRADVVLYPGSTMETVLTTGHVGGFEGKKVVKINDELNPNFIRYVNTSIE